VKTAAFPAAIVVPRLTSMTLVAIGLTSGLPGRSTLLNIMPVSGGAGFILRLHLAPVCKAIPE